MLLRCRGRSAAAAAGRGCRRRTAGSSSSGEVAACATDDLNRIAVSPAPDANNSKDDVSEEEKKKDQGKSSNLRVPAVANTNDVCPLTPGLSSSCYEKQRKPTVNCKFYNCFPFRFPALGLPDPRPARCQTTKSWGGGARPYTRCCGVRCPQCSYRLLSRSRCGGSGCASGGSR